MGYDSRVTGELTVTPPIPWMYYRDSQFRADSPKTRAKPPLLAFREEVTDEQTDTGTATTRRAVAVVARSNDAQSCYELADDLRALACGFGGVYRFTGWLLRDGDDQGDVERYTIRGTEVVTEKAKLHWPDGTEAP